MNSEPAESFRPMMKTARPRRPVYVFPGSQRRPLAALACDDPAPARRVADSYRHECPFRGSLPVPQRASVTPHHRQRGSLASGPIDLRCAGASSAICHRGRPAGPHRATKARGRSLSQTATTREQGNAASAHPIPDLPHPTPNSRAACRSPALLRRHAASALVLDSSISE